MTDKTPTCICITYETSVVCPVHAPPTQEPMWDEKAAIEEYDRSTNQGCYTQCLHMARWQFEKDKAQLEKMAEEMRESERNHLYFQFESKQLWYRNKDLQEQLAKLQQENEGLRKALEFYAQECLASYCQHEPLCERGEIARSALAIPQHNNSTSN